MCFFFAGEPPTIWPSCAGTADSVSTQVATQRVSIFPGADGLLGESQIMPGIQESAYV